MESIDWSKLRGRSRGRLPHWEVPGMTVFVTFRLMDSLPEHVVRAYRAERRRLDRLAAREPDSAEVRREKTRLFCRRMDQVLDQAHGSCALRDPALASLVMGAFRHFHGERYTLHAAVVMPNHAHVVATLVPEYRLQEVAHSWKSYTAHEAVKRHGQARPFWQDESYDHTVRDDFEFDRVVRYVVENPWKAGMEEWPHVFGRRDWRGRDAHATVTFSAVAP